MSISQQIHVMREKAYMKQDWQEHVYSCREVTAAEDRLRRPELDWSASPKASCIVFTLSGLTIRHFWCRWSRTAVILPWFIQLPWEAVQAPRGASLTSVPTKKCVLTLCSVRFSFPDPGFPAWKYPPVTLASLSGTPPSVAFDTDKPQTSWVTVNSYHCPTPWEDTLTLISNATIFNLTLYG